MNVFDKKIVFVGLTLLGGVFYLLIGQKGQPQDEPLDAFLKKNNTPRQVREAYEFALEHGDILEEIPCYCGCRMIGHDDNKNCFIKEGGGFDKMGLNCGECVAIALESKKLFKEGRPTNEIKEAIIQKYGHD